MTPLIICNFWIRNSLKSPRANFPPSRDCDGYLSLWAWGHSFLFISHLSSTCNRNTRKSIRKDWSLEVLCHEPCTWRIDGSLIKFLDFGELLISQLDPFVSSYCKFCESVLCVRMGLILYLKIWWVKDKWEIVEIRMNWGLGKWRYEMVSCLFVSLENLLNLNDMQFVNDSFEMASF